MVQHFLMVDLMLNMHGTNDSTSMKFCPTTTSHSVHSKRAVTNINVVSIDMQALMELIP